MHECLANAGWAGYGSVSGELCQHQACQLLTKAVTVTAQSLNIQGLDLNTNPAVKTCNHDCCFNAYAPRAFYLSAGDEVVQYLMAISKPSSTERAAKALGAFSIAACNAFIIASPLTYVYMTERLAVSNGKVTSLFTTLTTDLTHSMTREPQHMTDVLTITRSDEGRSPLLLATPSRISICIYMSVAWCM